MISISDRDRVLAVTVMYLPSLVMDESILLRLGSELQTLVLVPFNQYIDNSHL